jgi:hypothetical protein
MTDEPESYTPAPVAPPACPGCGDPMPPGTIASLCSRCLQGRVGTPAIQMTHRVASAPHAPVRMSPGTCRECGNVGDVDADGPNQGRCVPCRLAVTAPAAAGPHPSPGRVKRDDVMAATRALILAIGADPRSDRLAPVPALVADLCVRLVDGPADA